VSGSIEESRASVSGEPDRPERCGQGTASVELLIAGRPGPSFSLDPTANNVLGRSAEAVVTLPDRLASRTHAALRFESASERWTLHDLGSRNGTWLDGERIDRPRELRDGAVIRVGTSELLFRCCERQPEHPAAGPDRGTRWVRRGPTAQFEGMALRRSGSDGSDGGGWSLLLYQSGIRLLAARSVREVIGTVLELAAEHVGATGFGWFRVGDDGLLQPACVVPPGSGLPGMIDRELERLVLDEGDTVWVTLEPTLVNHAGMDVVCVPIAERRRGDALLAAGAPSGSLREGDFDFLVSLASLASAACAGRIPSARPNAEADSVIEGEVENEDDGATAGPEASHTVPLDPSEPEVEVVIPLAPEVAAEVLAERPFGSSDEGRATPPVAGVASLRLDDWQRALIIEALRRCGGSVPAAASELGISRATLYRKLEAYGLTRGRA
jgi:hypothetical protein